MDAVATLTSSIAELRSLMESADVLTEAPKKKKRAKRSGHYPFKNYKDIGPAIRDGENHEKRYWKCKKTAPYSFMCTGKEGEKKRVQIDKSWKKQYNKEYKPWRAAQGW